VSLRSRDAKQDIPVNSFALDLRQPIVPRPSRSPALRHSIASSLLASVPAPEMTGRPGRRRSVDSLWRYARRVSSIALRATGDYRPSRSLSMAGSASHYISECYSTSPFSLYSWQALQRKSMLFHYATSRSAYRGTSCIRRDSFYPGSPEG
jgi:hypothetical protein